MQQHLFEHFSSEGHNISIIFIDNTMSPLSLLITLIRKILTNGNAIGDIPLKKWQPKG